MKKKVGLLLDLDVVILLGTMLYCFFSCEASKKVIPLPEDENWGIGGSMAFDGNYFWGMRIPRSFTSEKSKEIVRFDELGQVVNIYTPEQNFSELAFDGKNVWTTDAFGSDIAAIEFNGNFYIIDPETGILKKQFRIYEDYMVDALAASGDRLWVYANHAGEEAHDKFILEIDIGAGAIINVMSYPEDISSTCSGMTYAGGHLWLTTGLIKHEVIKMNPQTGEIVKKYDFTGRVINGITTDGKNIYLADGEKHVLFILEK